MSFGSKVEEYRLRYGMNKKTLAARIGISPEHLTEITKDRVNPPKAKTTERIIQVLLLSPEEATDLRKAAQQRTLFGNDGQPISGRVINTL